MTEWKTYKLGEFAEINPRISLKQSIEYSFVEMKDLDATFKYVSPSTKKELKGGAKFQNGDTLFARITPCLENGKICQVKNLDNNVGFGSTEFLVFRGKENISNSDFIYYLSRSEFVKNNAIQMMTGTSGRQRVEKSALGELGITVPNLHTQTQIAQILSSLDDKIELNLQMNQTLEAMAQALFKEWFVDCVNDDWKTVCLGDLIEIKGGFSYKGEYIGNGDALLLGMGCVSFSERFLFSGARPYSGECGINHLANPGDIVIATRQQSDNLPILGFPAKIPISFSHKKVIVGTNLYKVINKSTLNNSTLFQLLRSDNYKNHILSNSKGSTVRMITKDSIELFEFKMPPKELLQDYENTFMSIDNKIERNIDQIQTLTQTRDTLLPKLMSGKINLKE